MTIFVDKMKRTASPWEKDGFAQSEAVLRAEATIDDRLKSVPQKLSDNPFLEGFYHLQVA